MGAFVVQLDVQTAFIIGQGLFTIGGVWFVLSYRMKALEKDNEKRKDQEAKRDQERTQASEAAMGKLASDIRSQLQVAQAHSSRDTESVRQEVRAEISLHRSSIADVKTEMTQRMNALANQHERDSIRLTEFIIKVESTMASMKSVVDRLQKVSE